MPRRKTRAQRLIARLIRSLIVIFVGVLSLAIAFALAFAVAALMYAIVGPFAQDPLAVGILVLVVGVLVAVSTVRYVAIAALKAIGVLVLASGSAEQRTFVRQVCALNVGAITLSLMAFIVFDRFGHVLAKCVAFTICAVWAWLFGRDFAKKASSLAWAPSVEEDSRLEAQRVDAGRQTQEAADGTGPRCLELEEESP